MLGGDDCRNRFFQRAEGIGGRGRVIVAAARLGGGDGGGACALDGNKAVGVNVSNARIAAAPRSQPIRTRESGQRS